MVHGEHNSPGAKKVWVYFSLGPARVRAWLLVILSVPVPAAPGVSPLIETHRLKFGKIATRDELLPGKGRISRQRERLSSAGEGLRRDPASSSPREDRLAITVESIPNKLHACLSTRRFAVCLSTRREEALVLVKPRRKLQRHDGAAAPVRGQIDIFAESAAAV